MQPPRDLFADCCPPPFSPPLAEAWTGINALVKAECEATVLEQRVLQRKNGEKLLTAEYLYPEPGLFLSSKSFPACFAQVNHIFSHMLRRARDLHGKAALSNKQWKEILHLPVAKLSTDGPQSHRAQELQGIADSFSAALSNQGITFDCVCPTPAGGFPIPSTSAGMETAWLLFEWGFRHEMVSIDRRMTDHLYEGLDSDEAADFFETRMSAFDAVFPEGKQDSVDASMARDGLCAPEWAKRVPRLEGLRKLVRDWKGPLELPLVLKVPFTVGSREQGRKAERALALHYAKTFYLTFERPAILPRAL